MPLELARFDAQGEIHREPDGNGYCMVIRLRNFSGPVHDEGHLSIMAWMYVSGALKRRGYQIKELVRMLP
jgi:hypothetical protein